MSVGYGNRAQEGQNKEVRIGGGSSSAQRGNGTAIAPNEKAREQNG
jgi:hypothetical protein